MNTNDRMTAGRVLLGAALRERRLASGRTLADVAELAGLSMSYLSEIERGRKLMSLDALDDWAVAMGVTVVDVLSDVYPFGATVRPHHVHVVPDARFRSAP